MGNKPSFMLRDEEITHIKEETGFSPAQIERLYRRFTALDKGCNGSLSRQDCLAIPELAINPLCSRIVQMFFIDCDEDHDRINFRQFMKVLAIFRSSNRSRNVSRQESLTHQHAPPLLFDTIDPTPFSSAFSRHHSRHSSYNDGFREIYQNHHHHHTTNQHSVHYASLTHLPSLGSHHQQHLLFNHHNNNNLVNGFDGLFKKPLVKPEEPINSRKNKLHFMFKIYDVNNDNRVDLEDLIAILKMMVGTYVDDANVRKIAERTLRESDKNFDGYLDFEEFCEAISRKDIDDWLKMKFPNS